MDVLVLWADKTKNVVNSNELYILGRDKSVAKGKKVKMLFGKRWYSGRIIAVDDQDSRMDTFNSSDDEPLIKYKNQSVEHNLSNKNENQSNVNLMVKSHSTNPDLKNTFLSNRKNVKPSTEMTENSDFDSDNSVHSQSENESPIYDSDRDPPYVVMCETRNCNNEIFSACHRCYKLLCFDHFDNNDQCKKHNFSPMKHDVSFRPEDFEIEGAERKEARLLKKRVNAQKLAKTKRNLGEEYVSTETKKVMPAKCMREACNVENCKKNRRQCFMFTDDDRNEIFNSYYSLGNLHLQRQFIVRHTESSQPKQRTTKNDRSSRRSKTIQYYLSKNSERISVCKKQFLNTLGISDRTVRTALSKVSALGILEGEKRGGRQSEKVRSRDNAIRLMIEQHIDRFPKVESHYCRETTSREYLHEDLSIPKMYAMFMNEIRDSDNKPSFITYRRIFKDKNLSFHHPKKDQCSLCVTFRQGDENLKTSLDVRYKKHIQEKAEVRRLKDECKTRAVSEPTFLCATFDLQ